ncbi:hypothetical protein EDB85DRAFT_417652 [Lactarius pseudohatsudake]|nr:hypothetical protein EDB85DRAFT_417652 [Lactarius pseudohatsudake]
MELDAQDVDGVEDGSTELVGPEDSEARSSLGPHSVNPLDHGCQDHYEQTDVPKSDPRRDTSVAEGHSSLEPEGHNVSGEGIPEPDLQDPAHESLEYHEPDFAPLWGDGPVVNDGEPGEAPPMRSTHYDTSVTSQGQEPVATSLRSTGDQSKEDSSAPCLHSEQPDREDEDMGGQNEGNVTSTGSDKPAQSHPELADISNLSPPLQVWVSSQVQNARDRARDTAKQHDREFEQTQARARKLMEENLQRQQQKIFDDNYRRLSNTPKWKGKPESLSREIWEEIDKTSNVARENFDSEVGIVH